MIRFLLIVLFAFFTDCIVAQESERQKNPCDHEAHRHFDFWLGDWKVYIDTTLAGTNSVVLLQDGCVLQENWIGSGGKITGTSYSFYNVNSKKWQQLWIDNQGSSLQLHGGRIQHRMELSSDTIKGKDGYNYLHRISWTPMNENHVIQHWELWNSANDDWKTLFNGDYKK